jgi:hypothetical protein
MAENPSTEHKLSRTQSIGTRLGTVRELYRYISEKRLWGMVVLVTTLLLFSIVVVTAEAVHFLAPFVYTIF